MSHTVLFKEEENKEFKKSQKKASKSDVDKSTLGDLDVLVDLKKKMDKE